MSAAEFIARGLPAALAVLLAIAGAALVLLAYRRERGLAPPRAGALITALRGAAVVLVVLLLADLALRRTGERTEPGELLLVIDGSRSMGLRDPRRPESQLRAESELLGIDYNDAARERLRGMTRLELVEAVLQGERPGRKTLLADLEARFRLAPVFLERAAAEIARGPDGELRLPAPSWEWTDLGQPVLDAALRRPREALAAVVLATDGGHNRGRRPEEVLGGLGAMGVPLFTLGAGAAERPRDLRIVSIDCPETVFRGDAVRAGLVIETAGLEARTLAVRVERDGEAIHEAAVDLPAGDPKGTVVPVPLEFKIEEGGRWKLAVSIPAVEGEAVAANNRREFRVRVIEEKVRVLFLDGWPRWEFRYLRNALESDPVVEAEVHLATRPPERRLPPGFPRRREEIFRYDAIILGDVERGVFTREELENLRDFVAARGGSLVLIAGERGMPYSFAGSPLEEVLPVELRAPRPPAGEGTRLARAGFRIRLTPAGERSPILRLDPDRERNRGLWSILPASEWFSPHGGAREGAEVLAALPEDFPLDPDAGAPAAPEAAAAEAGRRRAIFAARNVGAGRVFYSAIDSTWRWRYRIGEEHFARFWGQVIRWAAAERLPPGDGAARIGADQLRYEVPGRVSIRALVTGPDGNPLDPGARVDAEIVHQGTGAVHRLRLEPIPQSGGLYRGAVETGAGAGGLSPGEHRARLVIPAIPGYGERADRAAVDFAIEEPPSREDETLARDAALLAELAARGAPAGRYVPLERARDLLDAIPPRPRPIEETLVLDQWALAWPLLLMLAALLTAEWLLRKRHDLP